MKDLTKSVLFGFGALLPLGGFCVLEHNLGTSSEISDLLETNQRFRDEAHEIVPEYEDIWRSLRGTDIDVDQVYNHLIDKRLFYGLGIVQILCSAIALYYLDKSNMEEQEWRNKNEEIFKF